MSKLLSTRLPISTNSEISSDVYNRLVRILEINLGEFDPDNTRQLSATERDILFFNPGTIIWETSVGVLQVYTGEYWIDLSAPVNPQGYQANASVGKVSVKTNGDLTINLGSSSAGWEIEKYYS
tara:strand:- start:34 stop:405 length:372 start_codon:yes stop_codon:yes gene_type:complete